VFFFFFDYPILPAVYPAFIADELPQPDTSTIRFPERVQALGQGGGRKRLKVPSRPSFSSATDGARACYKVGAISVNV
jgi:hypothetical protein